MKDSAEEAQGLDRLLGRLAGRRAAKPVGRQPRQRFVTGGSQKAFGGLVAARRVVSWLAAISLAFSCADLLRPMGTAAALSCFTAAFSAILLVLPLFEIALGAGMHYEVQYKTGGRQLRKHRFEPSLGRLGDVLAPLVISVLGQLAGFASLHSWVSRGFAGSYSEALDSVAALYHSMITFAGGASAVVPTSGGAQALTAVEALLGWVAAVVAVGTVLAWVSRVQRPRKGRPE